MAYGIPIPFVSWRPTGPAITVVVVSGAHGDVLVAAGEAPEHRAIGQSLPGVAVSGRMASDRSHGSTSTLTVAGRSARDPSRGTDAASAKVSGRNG